MRRHFVSLLVIMLATGLGVPTALAQGGMQAGSVISSETGEPIVGASVVFENPAATPSRREEMTDESGNYSILGLMGGQWNLTVEAEGFQPNLGIVTLRYGRNTDVDIEMVRISHALEIALGREALEGLDAEALGAELDAADAAYDNGQWEEALAGYRSLHETLPTMNELKLQMGASLQQLGRYEEAIAVYEAAAAWDPTLQRDVDNAVARLRVAMGDLSAAETLVASGAAEREDLYNLGEVEFAKGEVDAAAEWYEKAVAADPNWVLPLFKLGLVSLNKGDIEGAKTYFSQVVEKDPDSAEGTQAQAVLSQLP